ncbi:uncharacterized protein LOC131696168 [Topomyia yanbarensis]|uniref:uncharacterized protein LOC131696110 n=1 Tax=Topomyia yanbarensis TaxID=2498891 RepID=UPI00273C6AC2|nr:uncharacterized protein LOC131696110 [Topomyia yanbarensis]XP_058840697.1 uncharacterized protein LOC131696168 [Topomyia yanbarensis]
MIDDRQGFNSHIDHACGRAVKVISALSRITPNNWAVNSSKTRLLAGPAWVTALQTKRNTSRLNSTLRLMAKRVSSAYRTVSSEAAYVTAGSIPINLLLEEDSECYRDRDTRGVRN